jgi:hypothetical protein
MIHQNMVAWLPGDRLHLQEDAKLPQVQHLINQLKRGIGVHHSGMLPLLKVRLAGHSLR